MKALLIIGLLLLSSAQGAEPYRALDIDLVGTTMGPHGSDTKNLYEVLGEALAKGRIRHVVTRARGHHGETYLCVEVSGFPADVDGRLAELKSALSTVVVHQKDSLLRITEQPRCTLK